jgi:hypothetical protein
MAAGEGGWRVDASVRRAAWQRRAWRERRPARARGDERGREHAPAGALCPAAVRRAPKHCVQLRLHVLRGVRVGAGAGDGQRRRWRRHVGRGKGVGPQAHSPRPACAGARLCWCAGPRLGGSPPCLPRAAACTRAGGCDGARCALFRGAARVKGDAAASIFTPPPRAWRLHALQRLSSPTLPSSPARSARVCSARAGARHGCADARVLPHAERRRAHAPPPTMWPPVDRLPGPASAPVSPLDAEAAALAPLLSVRLSARAAAFSPSAAAPGACAPPARTRAHAPSPPPAGRCARARMHGPARRAPCCTAARTTSPPAAARAPHPSRFSPPQPPRCR